MLVKPIQTLFNPIKKDGSQSNGAVITVTIHHAGRDSKDKKIDSGKTSNKQQLDFKISRTTKHFKNTGSVLLKKEGMLTQHMLNCTLVL